MSLFLLEPPTLRLGDFAGQLDQGAETHVVEPSDIRIDRAAGEIQIDDHDPLPISETSMEAIGSFLDVPKSFRKRLPEDLSTHLINELLQRYSHGDTPVVAKMNGEAMFMLREQTGKMIDQRQIVDIAARTLSEDALVLDYVNSVDEFSFDVIVPEDHDRGIGGDPKVGDISRAGLRFGQNIKENLAPWTSPLIYRLVCTNGMEIPDKTLRIEARGASVEQVLNRLELMAQRAFARVERDMEHFYDLRTQVVQHPAQTIARLARENRISDRLRIRLIDAVPSMEPIDGESITMFDITNLITNQANDEAISRRGVRHELQQFGGNIVTFHGSRCRTCASVLN